MLDIHVPKVQKLSSDELNEFFDWTSLHKTQRQFATTRARTPLNMGAMGSGKTRAAIVRSFNLSANTPYFGNLAGNTGIIGRFHRTDLIDTTMADFFELIDPTGWIKNYNKSLFRIELANGSVIQFVSLEEFTKFRSRNLGWAYFEQIEETPERTFEEIDGNRLRRVKTLTGNKMTFHSAFGVSNPCENWVADIWKTNEDYLTSPDATERAKYDPDFLTLHSSTYENAENLPPDYIPNMEKKYGGKNSKKGKMYLLGLWGSLAGSVYEWTDDLVNSKDIWPPLEMETIIGFDYGYGTEGVSSVTFGALEPISKGISKVHVYDELYLVSPSIEETVDTIISTLQFHLIKRLDNSFSLKQQVDLSGFIHDPAMRGAKARVKSSERKETVIGAFIREAMDRRFNLPAISGNNNIALGTDRTSWFIDNKLITFNPRCIHHRKSLKNYLWDEADSSNLKKNQDDHACDSLRYLLMHLSPIYHQAKEELKETIFERMVRRKKEKGLENDIIELGILE